MQRYLFDFLLQDQPNSEESVKHEDTKIKIENTSDDTKINNADDPEFHGFDETTDASGASVVNQLVGKSSPILELMPLLDSACIRVFLIFWVSFRQV